MARRKVAVTLDEKTLVLVDRLVTRRAFPSRSQVIQEALDEKLNRLTQSRLARECAKLNPSMEKSIAEEGIAEDMEYWPEY
jgi:Arc/MetJ-type ribon-helix-helix transcriptional regulator